MTNEINHCHKVLELENGASLEQVKQAWREMVKVWHPDRFPNDFKLQQKAQERIKEINRAYKILEKYLSSSASHTRSNPSASHSYTAHQNESQRKKKTERDRNKPPSPPPHKPAIKQMSFLGGILLLLTGLVFLSNNLGWLDYDIPLVPVALIAVGVYYVMVGSHRGKR